MKLAALMIAVLAAAPALAQPPAHPRQGPGHGPGGDPDRMAEVLKLTDAQKASWKEVHDAHRAEMKATFEEGRKLHEAVRAALDEPTPDAAKVGRAMIAAEKHRKKVDSSREALEEKLAALLDDEQKTRFETLRAMRGPGPGRGRGPGHGPGMRRGPGAGPDRPDGPDGQ